MKVKCILKEGINGAGYENMQFGEVRDLPKEIAEILISFNYAEKDKKQGVV